MIKRISTIVVVSCILILSLVGCSKGTVTKISPTPEAKIVSPIVGTWKYYKDVPKMPSYITWALTFAKDGTYTTSGDSRQTDKGLVSHADTWGAKGKYTVSEDAKTIAMTREDKGNTSDTKL